jgi:exonuclease III
MPKKYSDHSIIRGLLTYKGQSIKLASKNMQGPIGFRVPPAGANWAPKWDGPDLDNNIEIAVEQIKEIMGITPTNTNSEYDESFKQLIQTLRDNALSNAEKRDIIESILKKKHRFKHYKGVYITESVVHFKQRMTDFFEKMQAEHREVLFQQEVPRFDLSNNPFAFNLAPYEAIFNEISQAYGFHAQLVNAHTSRICSTVNFLTDTNATTALNDTPGLRHVIGETKDCIYINVHTVTSTFCDENPADKTRAIVSADKLSAFVNTLKKLQNTVTKPIIVAGDFNIPEDQQSQLEALFRENHCSFLIKKSRAVQGNPIVTLDLMFTATPDAILTPELSIRKSLARGQAPVQPPIPPRVQVPAQPPVPPQVMAQNLANNVKSAIETLYPFNNRFHLFKAKSEKYKLTGDKLKFDLLILFQYQLIQCHSIQQVDAVCKNYKQSAEYKILSTAQDLLTWLFSLRTSSEKAVDALIEKRKNQIA